jgi:hypothetical protein
MSTLSFIQARLKSSDSAKLAETTGYSQSHVINTLAGRRNNDYIVSAAKKLVSRRKAN